MVTPERCRHNAEFFGVTRMKSHDFCHALLAEHSQHLFEGLHAFDYIVFAGLFSVISRDRQMGLLVSFPLGPNE
jgi:hypothetical protein